jgi:ubiquinol-cytochrome c reductase cytochrome c1 subunit
MIRTTSIIAALMALTLGAGTAPAQESQPEPVATETAAEESGHATVDIARQNWSFAGVFGTYDEHQLQRGFQVYREVCNDCHVARLLAFRNLSEHGGPAFSEEQVKALAAEYEINDPEAEGGKRPGVPADRWPPKYLSEQEARDSNGGAIPVDFSVIAKARGISTPFPWWILNYFTGYSEGGPDYIHALLTGYHEAAPAGFELPEGKFYNDVFPGHAIGMSPPLTNGRVDYEGDGFPETVDQYAKDVSAFLMWVAEPHLADRKSTGFRVILFLVLFAGLMWFVKEKLWTGIPHKNPSPSQVAAQNRVKEAPAE